MELRIDVRSSPVPTFYTYFFQQLSTWRLSHRGRISEALKQIIAVFKALSLKGILCSFWTHVRLLLRSYRPLSLHIRLRPPNVLLQSQQICRQLNIVLKVLLRIQRKLGLIPLVPLNIQPNRCPTTARP